jgi:hypothetical protein
VERKNYPLIIALLAYLLILVCVVSSNLAYTSFETWLHYNGWPFLVAFLGPALALLSELSGVFRNRPQEFIATFIVYLLLMLALDFFIFTKTWNSGNFLFLLTELILLIYLLIAKIIIPSGEHFIVPLLTGFFMSLFLTGSWFAPLNAGLILGSGGLGIMIAGGIAALGHWRDRSVGYAIGGLILSVMAALSVVFFSVMTIGFT